MSAERAPADGFSPRPGKSVAAGLRSPFDARCRIRAVLFDLDGTLYEQRRMRALMGAELLTMMIRRPWQARRTLHALAAYRRAQEVLRASPSSFTSDPGLNDIAASQLQIAADRTGLPVEQVDQIVAEWMFDRPLKHLHRCRARGLSELLTLLDSQNLQLGVLSDYPADAKLRALGLDGRFSLVLSAGHPTINAMKPSPRGFLLACERWRIPAGEVLVVGDRVEVDAFGAAAAGMPCVIIGRSSHVSDSQGSLLALPSLERLHRVLDDCC